MSKQVLNGAGIRFEFGLMKGSIHSRGLVKLKSDPGLWNFNQIALKGHNAQ